MLKIILPILIFIPFLAVASGFTPPVSRSFAPTPLPPSALSSIKTTNSAAGCPSNDCNNYYSTLPDDLPDPVPSALEPAAGAPKGNFCRDVNVQNHPELCTENNINVAAPATDGKIPAYKKTRKRKRLPSNLGS